MPLKLAYLGLIERYLSANRAVTGVANDDEANAIRLFANDHVSYLLHATRVIFQGQSFADRYDLVVVKLGNAIVRWQRASDQDWFVRSEQVTMLPSSGFEVYDKERDEYFFMKHACLNETLSLDGEDSGNDPKFFPQNGDSDEKNLRTLIGSSVVAGISDAVLEQVVYGSLAHFYLEGRDRHDFIHDPE